MDAPQNAPRRARPPDARSPPPAPDRLAMQVALVLSGAGAFVAWILNSPLGADIPAGPGRHLIATAALLGCVLCAVGLALRVAALAWSGASVFAGVAVLVPAFWYAVPFALGLLGAVVAWERVRPKPPAPAVQAPTYWPPPWGWPPA